jgi:2,3-dihydroxyphenylpropionate 1,2-dioxygenase
MGKIVAAMSVSHAPGLTSLPDAPPKDQLENMHAALATLKDQLDEAKPDLIIAFVNDHFENYFRQAMPTFSIGSGDVNYGPPEHYLKWLQMERTMVPGNSNYAQELLQETLDQGFDLGRSETLDFGHNLMIPMHFLRPQCDIPVVPIFIDVFTPPLALTKRVYDLGRCIRRVIERRPEKVALLASGGLSHWPPFWQDQSPENDAFLRRMKRFQTEGLPVLKEDPDLFYDLGKREEEMVASGMNLVNPDWDHEILHAFENGDVEYFVSRSFQEIEREGGNGGHEILNWIALMGVLNGAKSRTLCYEPVKEWMCGMAFMTYDESLNEGRSTV